MSTSSLFNLRLIQGVCKQWTYALEQYPSWLLQRGVLATTCQFSSSTGEKTEGCESDGLSARIPNRQKRLERPTLAGPRELDRYGTPIWRLRQDTALARVDDELLKPIEKYELRNRIVYPPIEDVKKFYEQRGEECPRLQPPYVVHSRQQIRGYHNRLRHAANMVLGMSVDEACDQLEYHPLRGAAELKETILEAKERAIHEEGFEFGSNMYLAVSNVERGRPWKGVHKMGRMHGFKTVNWHFSNYIVMLVEGKCPKDFFPHDPSDMQKKIEDRLTELRQRDIRWDLKWTRVDVHVKRF